MKQLLTLLAAATVGTTISPLTLNVALFNNTTTPTPKFTTLMSKGNSRSTIRMSDTTAIISNEGTKNYLFDSTKVNTSSKGLINLNKVGKFIRLSDTIAIFIDRSYGTYLFDSTKVNTSSKGFTNLNQKYFYFYRLSDTTGVFSTPDTVQICFFDLTTMVFTNLNIQSTDFYFLSATTAIFKSLNGETYFFDSTKIDQTNKGVIKFEATFLRYIRMSDTTAIFWSSIGDAVLFDSTQVNNSSQGLTNLGQKVYQFYRLSDTTAIMSDLMTDEMLYFDVTKINDSSHGFTSLDKKLTSFYSLSETTGLFIEMAPYKGNFNTYFFDATKVNDLSHGFTLIKNDSIVLVHRLSDTLAIFGIANGSITGTPYSSLLFDATKVNDSSHGCISIKTMADFFSLTDTTGIFTSSFVGNNQSTFYFEYK